MQGVISIFSTQKKKNKSCATIPLCSLSLPSSSIAAITISLTSKLSLAHCDDHRLIQVNCVVYTKFFWPILVGKMNTTQLIAFDSFKSVVRSIWRFSIPLEFTAHGDHYLFTFANKHDVQNVHKVEPWSFKLVMLLPNNHEDFSNIVVIPLYFIQIWVQIIGLLPALLTATTRRVVGKTLGPVLQVDQAGFRWVIFRVRVSLPLSNLMRLQQQLQAV